MARLSACARWLWLENPQAMAISPTGLLVSRSSRRAALILRAKRYRIGGTPDARLNARLKWYGLMAAAPAMSASVMWLPMLASMKSITRWYLTLSLQFAGGSVSVFAMLHHKRESFA